MADEARVQVNLQIRRGNIDYSSRPTTFTEDVTGEIGPTPGAVAITTLGTDISFSQLTTPGFVVFHNLDDTNFVEWGIYEPATDRFYPVGEIGPGEIYVMKFSRNLLEEYYPATGTGTSAPTNTFRMKANTASCVVVVECFEK